jgi:hypothetical protein
MDLSPFPTSVVLSMIHFIYSDSAEKFSELLPEQICDAIKLSRSLEITGLVNSLQKILVSSLTPTNAFHVLLKSNELGFSEEIEWILWFIGKNKISPPVDPLQKLSSTSPTIVIRAFQEASTLSLPPPSIPETQLPSLKDDLDKLFFSGELADFELSVNGTVIPLHKCLLSSWDFSGILFHDRSHSPQVPLETFKKILRFLYSGTLDGISFLDAGYISAVSSFYLLENTELHQFCQTKLFSMLTPSNWMEGFVLGLQLEDPELQKKAASCAPRESPSEDVMKSLEGLSEANKALASEVEALANENRALKEENEKLKALLN